MKNKAIILLSFASALLLFFSCAREQKRSADVFLEQLQERDSVLIGDQLRYGFRINSIPEGTEMTLPSWEEELVPGVELLGSWVVDTLEAHNKGRNEAASLDLEAAVTVTSFDEGLYELPPIKVHLSYSDGVVDTREYDSQFLDVKTIPVDTTTFEVHPIKGQITYPLTFREVFPWLMLAIAVLLLVAALVWLIIYLHRRRSGKLAKVSEPAHIVALRKLDTFRGDSLWEPEKQKIFYSGVTDVLREYMDSRFGISAMEMTTNEILDELKKADISATLYEGVSELFGTADYVKFAKHSATREEAAGAVPFAVRFVTETYQKELESEQK